MHIYVWLAVSATNQLHLAYTPVLHSVLVQGYAVIPISRNDYWNGWVGFYPVNSSRVSVDEDAGMSAQLTIERRNATFDQLEVSDK